MEMASYFSMRGRQLTRSRAFERRPPPELRDGAYHGVSGTGELTVRGQLLELELDAAGQQRRVGTIGRDLSTAGQVVPDACTAG